jgi:hypothetical protein
MRAFLLPSVAFLTGILAAQGAAAAEPPPIGQVKVVSGEARALRAGRQLALRPGTPLAERDVVETGANSAVGMTFVDGSRLSLGPRSRLDLAEFSFREPGEEDEFEAALARGSLAASSGAIVQGRPGAMRIRTPTTILGVRGTEFVVRVAGP